ncbi:hypothetical protein FOA20_25855, partial [Peribacillus simplex]
QMLTNVKTKLNGLERKVRDSCGNTRQRETPQAQVRRGGSRTARGKRVPGVEINIKLILHSLKKTIRHLHYYRLSTV